MKHLARKLRRNQTDAERRLWQHLRNRRLGGFKFRRQHVIAPYVVDFVCIDRFVIVELDGGQHSEQREHDDARSGFLASKGFNVLRFWNNDVLGNTDAVLNDIYTALSKG